MNAIYLIYKKLFGLWCSNKPDTKETKYAYGISIKVTKDNNIDIICELPSLENTNNDQLMSISEKYAEILLFMNKGVFKNQIFEILTNHAKTNNDTKSILFIENILSFYGMIDIEYKKIKKQKSKSIPLIRPISVFKMN